MKRRQIVIICISILINCAIVIASSPISFSKEASLPEKRSVSVSASQDPFYSLFGKGRDYLKAGDYDSGIKYFIESLQYAQIGPEKAMSYSMLAEIYRD